MSRIPVESPLTYLARRRFPDFRWLNSAAQSADRRIGRPSPITPERQAEFDSWWAEHAALPSDELMNLVAIERAREADERARNIEASERARFFHLNSAAADFDYWSKMAHWSIDEAVALSLGKTPQLVNLKSIQPHAVVGTDGMPASPFAIEYLRRTELAKRSAAWQQLYDPVLPTLFLAWARRLELALPSALVHAVEARGHWIADWKGMYEELKSISDRWQPAAQADAAKVAELTLTLEQAVAERNELRGQMDGLPKAELATRERETLFKLVIGMAIAGYRYDPEAARNEAPGEISSDLAKLGIEVSDDTVRKWLKESVATVLPRIPRKA